MYAELHDWIADNVPRNGRVLEIGSFDVNGSVAHLFDDYTGIDVVPGPGVSSVCDVTRTDFLLRYGTSGYDTVLCLDTLEHIPHFWTALDHIYMALVRGGRFVCSVPTFGFPYHADGHYGDYYRFSSEAVEEFMTPYRNNRIDIIRDHVGNPGIVGIGTKP